MTEMISSNLHIGIRPDHFFLILATISRPFSIHFADFQSSLPAAAVRNILTSFRHASRGETYARRIVTVRNIAFVSVLPCLHTVCRDMLSQAARGCHP